MTTGQLLWAGLACCISALFVQLFPAAALALGVDLSAASRLFAFGVFLIAVASMLEGLGGKTGR